MKNYKSILIAGAVAAGLYLLLRRKKIIPMTITQKAHLQDKIVHMLGHLTPAEKDAALKAARRQKAAAEGTPEQETQLTSMEMMLTLRAQAEEKLSEEKQGTGFDYIRERAP